MSTTNLLFAGFGGQGILFSGKFLAYKGLIEDRQVSWLPSYGPEMRGGTANCCVVVSDEDVGSPVVVEADSVIVMNRPSLEKYEKNVVPGGKLFINSSLIEDEPSRKDIEVYRVPASEIADELGNGRVANIVMLGAMLEKTGIVSPKTAIKCLADSFGERKAHLIPLNEQAIQKGAEAVK